MINNATDFGKAFSALAISHSTRLANINLVLDAARALYYAIDAEIKAETLATGNGELTGSGSWDRFRGNGETPSPSGINDEVQSKGEDLWNVINNIS